jgi:hypothetical protein
MKVAPVSADLLIKLALGAAVLGGVWYALQKINAGFGSLGQSASDAADWVVDTAGYAVEKANYAFETANNAVAAPVIAAGEVLGIPRTSMTQCQIDIANGDTWAASFSCPLGTFADYLTTSTPKNTGGATGSW